MQMDPRRPVDILDQKDDLRAPLWFSLAFHAALATAMALPSLLGVRERWGSPDAAGGSVGINVVSSIPLPSRAGIRNPVAADANSNLPTPAVPEKRKPAERDPEAVALGKKKDPKQKKDRAEEAVNRKFRPPDADRANQIYGRTPQAASSPLFSQSGSGGVGTGPASSLGSRFGGYEALLRQRVAERWNTGDVDPRIRTAPIVIVTFDLARNGAVSNVTVLQRSNISALDYACQRAVLDAAPFPPLPPAFEREVAKIELWFELKR